MDGWTDEQVRGRQKNRQGDTGLLPPTCRKESPGSTTRRSRAAPFQNKGGPPEETRRALRGPVVCQGAALICRPAQGTQGRASTPARRRGP